MRIEKSAMMHYLRKAIAKQQEKLKGLEVALAIIETDNDTFDECRESLISEIHDIPVSKASKSIDPWAFKKSVSLNKHVKEVIENYTLTQDFVAASIEQDLIGRGIEIKGNRRSRIATELSKLKDEGFILRVYEGKGSEPHVYRKINKERG
jgi:hypothetical protein